MKTSIWTLLGAVTWTAAAALAPSASADTPRADGYTITEVGPAGPSSDLYSAYRLNNLGQVIGHRQTVAPPYGPYAFVWSEGVMTEIGSQAWGINDAGQVVGQSVEPGEYGLGFLWDSGEFTWISEGALYAINNFGQAVGRSGADMFLWSAGSITYLPTMGDGCVPRDISDTVYITGYARFAEGYRAFLYDSSGGIRDIGTLGGAGSVGTAVNNLGEVVGYSTYSATESDPVTRWRAFFYSDAAGIVDLGPFDGAGSHAWGINDSGQVVGHVRYPSAWPRAAIWEADGELRYLDELIPAESGWVFEIASDINELGQIVGVGVNPAGELRGFLLTPVEVKAVTFRASTVVGGAGALCTVSLTGPVARDVVIPLTSSGKAARVPRSVIIRAGTSSTTFTIPTTAVTENAQVTVTATYRGESESATLTVRPIGPASVRLSPTSVFGGASVTGTISLERAAAPGAITVTLASSGPSAAQPSARVVIIPANSRTGTFTVKTYPVRTTSTVRISAAANGRTAAASLRVLP